MQMAAIVRVNMVAINRLQETVCRSGGIPWEICTLVWCPINPQGWPAATFHSYIATVGSSSVPHISFISVFVCVCVCVPHPHFREQPANASFSAISYFSNYNVKVTDLHKLTMTATKPSDSANLLDRSVLYSADRWGAS